MVVINFLDFLKTTLSTNGFGYISGFVNKVVTKGVLKTQNKKIFKYSGLLHLLSTFFVWLSLLFLGTFLIFSSNEGMVVESTTGAEAGLLERFYFSSAILTTLGIGDFIPGTDFTQLLASLLAITGFIMLTTGISYLISVLNGVNQKKSLANYINGMGVSLDEIYEYAAIKGGESNLLNQSSQLRSMIISFTSQHWALPIIHYFFSTEKSFSVAVQIARLYEVLNAMSFNYKNGSVQKAQIRIIQKAIDYLLRMSLNNNINKKFKQAELQKYRMSWKYMDEIAHIDKENDQRMDAFLKSCGWSWKHVYEP